MLVTAPGDLPDAEHLVEVLTRFPEVRSIHWAVNDTPAEVTNLPSRLLWGDDAIEEELARASLPRAAECVPPDEHGDVPSGSTSSRSSTRA